MHRNETKERGIKKKGGGDKTHMEINELIVGERNTEMK